MCVLTGWEQVTSHGWGSPWSLAACFILVNTCNNHPANVDLTLYWHRENLSLFAVCLIMARCKANHNESDYTLRNEKFNVKFSWRIHITKFLCTLSILYSYILYYIDFQAEASNIQININARERERSTITVCRWKSNSLWENGGIYSFQ